MIKGAQKKVVVVRTGESEIFEEAFFVLRDGGERTRGDMIAEANRIIETNASTVIGRGKVLFSKLVRFIFGFFCGSAFGSAAVIFALFLSRM